MKNYELIQSLKHFKKLLKQIENEKEYTFIKEDNEKLFFLLIAPSLQHLNYFYITKIEGFVNEPMIAKGLSKPIIKTHLYFLFKEKLYFDIINAIVLIRKSKKYFENEWITTTNENMGEEKKDVYFIQSIIGGPIKIGVSNDPLRRMKEFQYHSPFKLKLLATIDEGEYARETKLHRLFSKVRLHGEWFEPIKPLLDYIEKIKENDEIEHETI